MAENLPWNLSSMGFDSAVSIPGIPLRGSYARSYVSGIIKWFRWLEVKVHLNPLEILP